MKTPDEAYWDSLQDIKIPEGLNPYDYADDDARPLATIWKFGYRQCKRGRPYEDEGLTPDAKKAFSAGYEAAK